MPLWQSPLEECAAYSARTRASFQRVSFLRGVCALAGALGPPVAPALARPPPSSTVLSLTEGGGGALCVAFTLDGLPFRAIVDTGSPFLTVPAETDCTTQPRRDAFFGCAPAGAFRPSSLQPSLELYGVTEAVVKWRVAELTGLAEAPLEVVVGAAPRPLVEASGGTFAGLIANGDGTRPTFLSQLYPAVSAFVLDGRGMELRLHHGAPGSSASRRSSRLAVPADADALCLTDLRLCGDPVDHYAVRASGLRLDGQALPLRRPLIAVFDSGLSGALLSRTLCDEAGGSVGEALTATRLSAATSLEVDLPTEFGRLTTLRASRSTTPRLFRVGAQPVPWFADRELEPSVVVLGQAFLRHSMLAIDLVERRARCVQIAGPHQYRTYK